MVSCLFVVVYCCCLLVDPRSYCNPDLLDAIKSSTGDRSASNDTLMAAFQSTTTENEIQQVNKINCDEFI